MLPSDFLAVLGSPNAISEGLSAHGYKILPDGVRKWKRQQYITARGFEAIKRWRASINYPLLDSLVANLKLTGNCEL